MVNALIASWAAYLNDNNSPLTGECSAKPVRRSQSRLPRPSIAPLIRQIRSVLTCESRRAFVRSATDATWPAAWYSVAKWLASSRLIHPVSRVRSDPPVRSTSAVWRRYAVETNGFEIRRSSGDRRASHREEAEPAGAKPWTSSFRVGRFRIVDPKTEIVLYTHNLPYGSMLYMSDGAEVKKGDMICEWDPYNAVIISEHEGKAVYDSVIEGVTYRDERDEQTGLSEKVIIESKDKTKNPVIKVINKEGEEVKSYNLPVSAHVVVKDNAKIKAGDILIKIPRAVGKSGGDITGGLPRVTELFEARNPSNPAIVSEIDGEVTFGKIKRGNREIIITSKEGDVRRYLVPLSRQIIVQENDYVKAGGALSDGAITPSDILNILPLAKCRSTSSMRCRGVPYAGREDQRQAFRGDRTPDDVESQDRRSG